MKPIRAILYIAATFALAATLPPITANARSSDVPQDGQISYRALTRTSDGQPVPPNHPEYYPVDMSQYHQPEPQPGVLHPNKPAPPLPTIPDSPDSAFASECTSDANKDTANTSVGWTKNHYEWCKTASEVWQKLLKKPDGSTTVVGELVFGVVWMGYADPANRRFVTFALVYKPTVVFGSFDPNTNFVIDTLCKGGDQSSCSTTDTPSGGFSLSTLQSEEPHVVKTVITDTTLSHFPLTGDQVANLDINAGWEAFPPNSSDGQPIIFNHDPVHSRCDSAGRNAYRTDQACIFNNVSPFLVYDRADTAYPVDQIVDHIKYAQDTLGAPGKFASGKPAGPPLTRNRDQNLKLANYNASKAKCKTANGGQPWNWRKIQCDEYPFQSTNQGATASNPSSARLLNARQNSEGGNQLGNWYKWDRVLNGDQFWVQAQ